jgi:glycosyltransferase involved in cell wall biosynthesis
MTCTISVGGKHYNTDYNKEFDALELEYVQLKMLALQDKKIVVNALSKWLLKLSKQSRIFKNTPHYNIPNCLGWTDAINQRNSIRHKSILFLADNILDTRKGFKYLLNALEYLPVDLTLHIVGKMDYPSPLPFKGKIKCHGFIKSEKLLKELYSSSLLFVIPSLEDNLPNTIVESHMCGTPVVGFNRTGVADMITNKVNGLLVDEVSGKALARGILEALRLSDKGQFDYTRIAQEAKAYYDEKTVVESYLQLIEDLT